LQYVALCCSVLQYVALCCSVLQYVALCCSVLQYVALCCSVWQIAPSLVIQCVAVCLQCVCSVFAVCLQCVCSVFAVCCSVFAVCCSVLQMRSWLPTRIAPSGMLQRVGRVLQCVEHGAVRCVAVCCSVLQCVCTVFTLWLQCVCSVLQRYAKKKKCAGDCSHLSRCQVCCRVLWCVNSVLAVCWQCVAVCCRVLRYVEMCCIYIYIAFISIYICIRTYIFICM